MSRRRSHSARGGRWASSAWSAEHGRGCSHPPTLEESQISRGTSPGTPARGGRPPSGLPLAHKRSALRQGESCGSRGVGVVAITWALSSHPPALGVLSGICGTPPDPRQRGESLSALSLLARGIALRGETLAATIGNAGGAVAQSGERLPGRQKVGGSNPPSSTKSHIRQLPGTGVVGPGIREPAAGASR